MKTSTIFQLQKMIDVNTPLIYINDYDFVRVDRVIYQAIQDSVVYEWNPATGRTDFFNKAKEGNGTLITLEEFLYEEYILEIKKERFLVLKEIQDELESPKVRTLLLLMAQKRLYDLEFNTTVIIVSTVINVPTELRKYVSFLEIPLPDEDEISELIKTHTTVNHYDKFEEKDKVKLMPSLKGMTSFEIDRMLDMAMSKNGSLNAEDKEMILQQKKQMVKQSGLLELISIDSKKFRF